MRASQRAFVMAAIATVYAGITIQAQDAEESAAPSRTPRPPEVRYQYVETKEPLETLQQTIAANDAILAKQKECLSELAQLAERAEANKAAAHRSTSRGRK